MSREKTISQAESPDADWRSGISKEIKKAERLFVLGVGNRRRGDDAAGGLCVRFLKKEIVRRRLRADASLAESGLLLRTSRKGASLELEVLDAGEIPESVTGLIREFQPTHVLIVDTAVGGHRPGTIFIVDKKKIRQEEISTHRLPLFHLVRYLEETICCRVILVGIEPQEVGWGKPVSAAVRSAAAELAEGLMAIAEGISPI